MLTDEDRELICQLVDERYSAIREATRLVQQAKEKRESVKNITVRSIAEKFDVSERAIINTAQKYGVNMNRK